MAAAAEERLAFHRTLPAKRMGAGAIIRDTSGSVLIVKPTYKDGWEMPGGAVEAGESPAQACVREVREELGLEIVVGRMVCVDYNAGGPDYLESLMFLFDTGVMDEATTARIELQEAELSEFRFVPVAEATTLLVERAGRRLATVLSGDGAGEVYLENQRPR
ncbi:MAG: NUDIX hydrolase [Ilumatobacteraceae bacterium]|jgi:8-oxo-dGTP pyrophosphatase MutT (NUDIX family)